MKKIFALLIAVISMFTFSSCIILNIPFRASQSTDQVDNIYVYYLDGQTQDVNLYPEPIDKLEEWEFGSFIQEAEDLPFKRSAPIIPIPIDYYLDHQGYTVKIEYNDGSYDLLSCTFLSDSDGSAYKSVCDEEVWLAFLQKYVDLQNEPSI